MGVNICSWTLWPGQEIPWCCEVLKCLLFHRELIAYTKMLHNKLCIKAVVVQRSLVAFFILSRPFRNVSNSPWLLYFSTLLFLRLFLKIFPSAWERGTHLGGGLISFFYSLFPLVHALAAQGIHLLFFNAQSLRGFFQGSGFLQHRINTDTSQLWILIEIKASAQARLAPPDASFWQMSPPSFLLALSTGYAPRASPHSEDMI